MALDRIKDISIAPHVMYDENKEFDPETYYKDVIGVTVERNRRPQKIHLMVDRRNAPYVITKPLHSSQQVISTSKLGIEITIDVQVNFELEREILGFGESIEVIKPEKLRNRILSKLKMAVGVYETDKL